MPSAEVVIGMALRYRAQAALIKGAPKGLFGLWVIGVIVWHAFSRRAAKACPTWLLLLLARIGHLAV